MTLQHLQATPQNLILPTRTAPLYPSLSIATPAPTVGTSLESHETNAHLDPLATSGYQRWLHRGLEKERLYVYTALSACGKSDRVLSRFKDCGAGATVSALEGSPHVIKVCSSKCRNRFCPACTRSRGGTVHSNLFALANSAHHRLKLLTFTLAHTACPLRKSVDRLTAAFRELRRLRLWQSLVRAAAWVLEVKVGRDGYWHPHIHVLIDAPYISVGHLSSMWLACTGDSYIVHVKAITAQHGASYVAKYVSKPLDKTIACDPSRLEEYIVSMRGKRTVACLGAWRKTKLTERHSAQKMLGIHTSESPEIWRFLGFWEDIEQRARDGNAVDLKTIDLVTNHRQETMPCFHPHRPRPPPTLPPPRPTTCEA